MYHSADDRRLDAFGALLPQRFFLRDTESVARDLLGRVLVTKVDDMVVAGRIVETEAYLGADDPGSHASTRGVTRRNVVMFGPPGVAYVYFTYGNHHMLNVVTEVDGTAGAVLIRAVEPLVGEDVMSSRRHGRKGVELCNGPGKLARAFGVDLSDNATRLGEGRVSILEGEAVVDERVGRTGRIGLSRGHELPLRFVVVGSPYVSRGRVGPLRTKTRSRVRKEST